MRVFGFAVLVGALLLGCGPQVELELEDGSSGGEPGPGTTPRPPATSTSTTTSTTLPPTPDDTSMPPDDDVGDSVGFVGGDDAGFPDYCSTILQDCPPGYKCMPWADDGGSSWNATKCVEIAPDPAGPGEPCIVEGNGVSGIDDCDGTSMCWDVDPETNMGECIEFCTGSEDNPLCPNPCDSCSITGDGVLNICLAGCDPIAQDCPEGQACYPYFDDFVCAPDASGDRSGPLGSPCEFINVCDPGLACIPGASVPGCMTTGCCAPFCATEGIDPCPGLLPGTVCTVYFDEGGPAPGCAGADAGICVLP